ncbi:AraC family ligand binding domain-containing protein [Limosilactobacillus mucosae]|uniref:AraC family ligand binding domain-containing protein n=1 Tax=Limosilactobacillus mucosae TaxID=97478 RepID=UPI003B5201C7
MFFRSVRCISSKRCRISSYTIDTEVPWHWHDAFEIELIHHGTITLFDQTASHQLKEGDLCLIRPQALHALKSEHCEFYAHRLHRTF